MFHGCVMFTFSCTNEACVTDIRPCSQRLHDWNGRVKMQAWREMKHEHTRNCSLILSQNSFGSTFWSMAAFWIFKPCSSVPTRKWTGLVGCRSLWYRANISAVTSEYKWPMWGTVSRIRRVRQCIPRLHTWIGIKNGGGNVVSFAAVIFCWQRYFATWAAQISPSETLEGRQSKYSAGQEHTNEAISFAFVADFVRRSQSMI